MRIKLASKYAEAGVGKPTIRAKRWRLQAFRMYKKYGWAVLQQARWFALSGAYDRALQKIGTRYWMYRYPHEAMRLFGNVLVLQHWAGQGTADQLQRAAAIYQQALGLAPDDADLADDLAEVRAEIAQAA